MANRITIEISEYPHEILKQTVEEINEVSPLKLSTIIDFYEVSKIRNSKPEARNNIKTQNPNP